MHRKKTVFQGAQGKPRRGQRSAPRGTTAPTPAAPFRFASVRVYDPDTPSSNVAQAPPDRRLPAPEPGIEHMPKAT